LFDGVFARCAVQDETFLMKEMQAMGLGVEKSRLDEIKAELTGYYNNNVVPHFEEGPARDSGIDMSIIDNLLQDDSDLPAASVHAAVTDAKRVTEAAGTKSSNVVDIEDEELDNSAYPVYTDEVTRALNEIGLDVHAVEDENKLADLRREYKLVADSALEQARIRNHEAMEVVDWRLARSQVDMDIIHSQR
jgi:hypothetical protein